MEKRPSAETDRATAILIFIGTVAMLIAGLVLLYVGLDAWSTGQIWVSPKATRPYLATAAGEHSKEFFWEMWTKLALGFLITVVTGGFLLTYLLSSPTKRREILNSFKSAYRKHRE